MVCVCVCVCWRERGIKGLPLFTGLGRGQLHNSMNLHGMERVETMPLITTRWRHYVGKRYVK